MIKNICAQESAIFNRNKFNILKRFKFFFFLNSWRVNPCSNVHASLMSKCNANLICACSQFVAENRSKIQVQKRIDAPSHHNVTTICSCVSCQRSKLCTACCLIDFIMCIANERALNASLDEIFELKSQHVLKRKIASIKVIKPSGIFLLTLFISLLFAPSVVSNQHVFGCILSHVVTYKSEMSLKSKTAFVAYFLHLYIVRMFCMEQPLSSAVDLFVIGAFMLRNFHPLWFKN